MKTKAQKVAEARKNAEKLKATRKQARDAKASSIAATSTNGKKGKSVVPQSKSPKKK